jgi:hypothetical protein
MPSLSKLFMMNPSSELGYLNQFERVGRMVWQVLDWLKKTARPPSSECLELFSKVRFCCQLSRPLYLDSAVASRELLPSQ